MNIERTFIDGLIIIRPEVFQDERGFFLETYCYDKYAKFGITENFVQDNQSRSVKGVLRGMHYQINEPQAQILTVLTGKIFDVCVDVRPASLTFGQWFGIELSEDGNRQIYMAPGFAHGFCVLSETANLHYKVSSIYSPDNERGLLWSDPDLKIKWPISNPIISQRDQTYPGLKEIYQNS